MSRKLTALLILSGLFAATAHADDTFDNRYYVSPNLNYTFPDSNWHSDGAMGFGVGFGKAVSQSFNLEANAAYAQLSPSQGNNISTTDLNVDAMYFFSRNTGFSPFVEAGIGSMQVDKNSASWYTDGNVGVGFMTWLKGVAIRGDLRYRYTDGINNLSSNQYQFSPHDVIASIGLVIPLGAAPAPAPAPAPEPAPAPVAAEPAPAPAPAPAPEPAPAIERPAAHTKLTLQGAHFDVNKASLRPTGKATLDQDASMLTTYPDIKVNVTGYTDSTGSKQYNLKLSRARAETVVKYLEGKGIAHDRFVTVSGKGESDPVASNKTKAGRAKNRRVEIETLN